MKTKYQLDREIKRVADFVNSFPCYDPLNYAQAQGFAVLNALEWAAGRRTNVMQPSYELQRKFKRTEPRAEASALPAA